MESHQDLMQEMSQVPLMVLFDGSADGNIEGSALRVSLEYSYGIVIGCKLGSTDGKLLEFTLENADGLELGIDEGTDLGFFSCIL